MQATPAPVEISVRYQLREYLRFVSEFKPRSAAHREAMQKAATSRWTNVWPSSRWLQRVAIAVLVTPIFFYKRSAVGTCVFRMDSERMSRKSKAGTLAEPWSGVVLVHRLSEAYMVELERGAMPLPYRCFLPEQRPMFESFVPEGKLGPRHVV